MFCVLVKMCIVTKQTNSFPKYICICVCVKKRDRVEFSVFQPQYI